MSWPPIPSADSVISQVSVPENLCFPAPFCLSAPLPEVEVSRSIKHTQSAGVPATLIIARPVDGRYEILCGWQQLQIWIGVFGSKSIPLSTALYTDAEALAIAIRHSYEEPAVDAHRLWLARALAAAKHHLKCNDTFLSKSLGKGYSRPAISNILRLNNLSKQVQDAYLDGLLKHSYARALCAADSAQQEVLLPQILNGSMNLKALETSLGYKHNHISNVSEPVTKPKSIDEKRFEIDLSSALGAPTEVDTNGTQGSVTIQFHSLSELANIADRIDPRGKGGRIKGKVLLTYESLDELDAVVNPILGYEEDW